MSLKIFHCRCCGAKVSWSATSCSVCNRLVSNDRMKRRIIFSCIAVIVIMAVVILFGSKLAFIPAQ